MAFCPPILVLLSNTQQNILQEHLHIGIRYGEVSLLEKTRGDGGKRREEKYFFSSNITFIYL